MDLPLLSPSVACSSRHGETRLSDPCPLLPCYPPPQPPVHPLPPLSLLKCARFTPASHVSLKHYPSSPTPRCGSYLKSTHSRPPAFNLDAETVRYRSSGSRLASTWIAVVAGLVSHVPREERLMSLSGRYLHKNTTNNNPWNFECASGGNNFFHRSMGKI